MCHMWYRLFHHFTCFFQIFQMAAKRVVEMIVGVVSYISPLQFFFIQICKLSRMVPRVSPLFFVSYRSFKWLWREECTGGRQCVRCGTPCFTTSLCFLLIFQMAVEREVYRWTSVRQVWYPVFHHFPVFLTDLSDGCGERSVQVDVSASGVAPCVSPLPFVSLRSFRWLWREKCTGGRQCARCGTPYFTTSLCFFQMVVEKGVQVDVNASGAVPCVSPLLFASFISFRWL